MNMNSCSFLPTPDAAKFALQSGGNAFRRVNPQGYLANMLRGNAKSTSHSAIEAVDLGGFSQLGRDTFKVNSQVERSEDYERNHTTGFIGGQEEFSVQKKEKNALVAQKIRELRKRKGLNQVQFAEHVGFDQTTVSKWEGGKVLPTPLAFSRLAEEADDAMDKLFFLEHAGIPSGYLIGEPMHPQIKAATDRVVESAIGSKPTLARNLPDKEMAWDRELLVFVIETVSAELKKRAKKLPIRKYAELVAIFYEFCHRTGTRDADMLERLLLIA